MSSFNSSANKFKRTLLNYSVYTKKHGEYQWHLPNGFDSNQRREVVLTFSRRPTFLYLDWFSKATGPMTTSTYRQFTTDSVIKESVVQNSGKNGDDYDEDDYEVQQILSHKKPSIQQRYIGRLNRTEDDHLATVSQTPLDLVNIDKNNTDENVDGESVEEEEVDGKEEAEEDDTDEDEDLDDIHEEYELDELDLHRTNPDTPPYDDAGDHEPTYLPSVLEVPTPESDMD